MKKESLRDNMTNVELALNTLAEVSATEISRSENPKGFFENADIARRGGDIARQARQSLETQTGRSVISPTKASNYLSGENPEDKQQMIPGTEENE